ncbi:RNA polymerase sigma factor RpoE [hydrothermal vent metagenome]|uniref:RNA polymerase sigma factor RpoE n=1 Tax=hydrothermal vent metagenome TaxID=652676 RepID=A0A3B0Y348_9ZZZZ
MSVYESGIVTGFGRNVTPIKVDTPKSDLQVKDNLNKQTQKSKLQDVSNGGQARMGEREIDQALVERVQQGDKKAFDVLVLKYQHRIIKLVARFVRNSDEVQDVTQEAFIKAYRALKNFRGDSAFYTWLYRIAINTAKNYLVSASRRATESAVDVQDAEQYDTGDWLREYATPEKELLAQEIKKVIHKTISDLPSDLKEAVTLREMEGLSYEEIADVMDCPIGTVRSRIFRAREAIDKQLKPLLDERDAR